MADELQALLDKITEDELKKADEEKGKILAQAKAEADDNGYLHLEIRETPDPAQDLLRGFRLHMTELAKDYPQYVLCKTIQL